MKQSVGAFYGGVAGAFAAGVLMLGDPARADIVIDLDPITPGIQTTLSVSSGSSVTLITYYDPTLSGPIPFNAFGIDLNWTGVGTATATPTTAPLAGSLTLVGPIVFDFVSGAGPLPPGTPLVSAGMPPGAGAFSIGGVGLVDISGSFFTFGGPIPGPVDLFGITFTVSGAVGETLTFTPSGIVLPTVGGTPGIGPFIPGGDHYQIAPGSPTPTISDAFIASSVITIIPEPSVLVYMVLGLLALRAGHRAHAARSRT